MSQLFYLFDWSSGSTWGKYLVPVSCYTVARNKAGEIRLTNAAYPDNVPYTDVKNLEVVCGDNPEAMRGILKRITSAPI